MSEISDWESPQHMQEYIDAVEENLAYQIDEKNKLQATIAELKFDRDWCSERNCSDANTIAELKREVAKRDYNPLAGMTALKEPDS